MGFDGLPACPRVLHTFSHPPKGRRAPPHGHTHTHAAGTPRHHAHVRRCAVAHMQRQRREFEAFLGEEVGWYVRDVARRGAWGDELTLRAASEALAVVVNVISSGGLACGHACVHARQ